MNDIERILSLPQAARKKFFDELDFYTYALCELSEDNKRIPFYIGKGKNERCLHHLDEKKETEKTRKIKKLANSKKLGIDILAYGLKESESLIVESVCIDLLNIDDLTNAVRGHRDNTKRLPIGELASMVMQDSITIPPEHKGVAFLLEKSFMHDFGDLQLLEHTRGIWTKKQPESVKYAYATYRGIIKEVYEIYTWVPAGTQQYFTRELDPEKAAKRHEFVGKKAPEKIRNDYIGKLINKKRSYGNPFVRVGFESDSQ